MMEREELHDVVAERLDECSQRYTTGRRHLIDVLARSGRPLTIPEIVARRKSLPQSSVYRNLAILEEARTVRRLPGADEFARYELAEDLTEHHHHLVCARCGEVSDYTLPARLERTLQRTEDDIAASTGFRAERHQLDFVGVCRECAASA